MPRDEFFLNLEKQNSDLILKRLTVCLDKDEAENYTYSKCTSFLLRRVDFLELMMPLSFDTRIREE